MPVSKSRPGTRERPPTTHSRLVREQYCHLFVNAKPDKRRDNCLSRTYVQIPEQEGVAQSESRSSTSNEQIKQLRGTPDDPCGRQQTPCTAKEKKRKDLAWQRRPRIGNFGLLCTAKEKKRKDLARQRRLQNVGRSKPCTKKAIGQIHHLTQKETFLPILAACTPPDPASHLCPRPSALAPALACHHQGTSAR